MAYDEESGVDEGQEQNKQEERMQHFRQKWKGEKLKPLMEAYVKVKARQEALKEDLAMCNAEFDVLRFEMIPDRADADGVERVTFEGIGRLQLTADVRVHCPAANRAGFFSWLRKNKFGDLITETVNASTLKAFIKRRVKEGKKYPDDLLKVTQITRASVVKA